MALARANSRSPSAPCTRPNPDSPTPPKGSPGTVTNPATEFTEVIPLRSDRAATIPGDWDRDRNRRVRPVKTADPSPYTPPLASATPVARSGTGVTVTVGPKVSSVTAAEDSGTPVSTTGRAHGPDTFSVPPTTACPPSASASATCFETTAPCVGEVSGP